MACIGTQQRDYLPKKDFFPDRFEYYILHLVTEIKLL